MAGKWAVIRDNKGIKIHGKIRFTQFANFSLKTEDATESYLVHVGQLFWCTEFHCSNMEAQLKSDDMYATISSFGSQQCWSANISVQQS